LENFQSFLIIFIKKMINTGESGISNINIYLILRGI
jgi:hypothetical protein